MLDTVAERKEEMKRLLRAHVNSGTVERVDKEIRESGAPVKTPPVQVPRETTPVTPSYQPGPPTSISSVNEALVNEALQHLDALSRVFRTLLTHNGK